MSMESLSFLPELQGLPAVEGADALEPGEAVALIRTMDRGHFAIEVSQATEEALEALFDARNAPDVLDKAYGIAFSDRFEQGKSLNESHSEAMQRGLRSETGFVSNLKGKVAELEAETALEERHLGYGFKLAESATQSGWDLIGTSPSGEDIFIQVKVGAEGYAYSVVEDMHAYPNYPFAVSTEIYDAIENSHPELFARLTDIGSVTELTEFAKGGLEKLSGNMGIDVPDSLREVLPYVGEIVLGIKLIWDIVRTERELKSIDLTDRSRVHGIRALALTSRFGVNQVCLWAGTSAGAAVGTAVPGVGNVAAGLGGSLAGIGGGMLLNRMLQPRIEEVAIKLVGGDPDDIFYLMNKAEIDQLGQSFAVTQVA